MDVKKKTAGAKSNNLSFSRHANSMRAAGIPSEEENRIRKNYVYLKFVEVKEKTFADTDCDSLYVRR